MIKLKISPSIKYPGCKTILLELIDLNPDVKKEFIFEDIKLYLKDEFHITLIGNEDSLQLKEKLSKLNKNYAELESDINKLLLSFGINFISEFHILRKKYSENDTRTSLIQIIETNIIDDFRELLKVKYDFEFSHNAPQPHITLYKEKDNNGIGLYSSVDLEKYSIKKLTSLINSKFKEKEAIEIDSDIFTVTSVRDVNFTHTEDKKTYYIYSLRANNANITHSSLDYIADDDITLHLTKKVKSEIKEKEILIDSEVYEILTRDVGIFMDYGEHKDVHEYKLKSKNGELSELHVLPDDTQIFYLNRKITLSDIK